MKKTKRVILGMLCVCLILGCFSIPMVNAKSEAGYFDIPNNESNSFCGTSLTASNVCLESRKFVFSDDENIVVSYYVNSEDDITDISYTQTGFDEISVGIDDEDSKRIVVELACFPNAEEYIGKFM